MSGAAMPAAIRLFPAGNALAMTGSGLVIALTLIYPPMESSASAGRLASALLDRRRRRRW